MKKLPAFIFFIFLLFVAYWADTGTMPSLLKALVSFPNSDRVGHLVLYGVLAYLFSYAFPFRRVRLWRWNLRIGVVIALAFATLEEASQLFIPGRTADLVDLAFGFLGIYLSTWIPCMGDACETPSASGGDAEAKS